MMVPFLLGSDSDLPHAEKIAAVLKDFDVPYKFYVASAHKVPTKTLSVIEHYNEKEGVVFITIAGRSNALSGVTAGNTHHPVVACPPFKDYSDYAVNIHSTLQMPSNTPVLTVVDTQNAGLTVVRILALRSEELARKMKNHLQVVKDHFKVEL